MKTIAILSTSLVLALVGCKGMIKTNGSAFSSSPSSSSTTSPSESSSSESSLDARSEAPSASPDNNPFIEKPQIAQLIGKTPDEARKLLKGFGHRAEVIVKTDSEFNEGCADDRVCFVRRDGPGTPTKHENIVLYVNPKLEIGGPPPE